MISLIKKITPSFIRKGYHKSRMLVTDIHDSLLIKSMPKRYEKAVTKIRKKSDPIHIVFFGIDNAAWKYESFYRLVENDPRFKLTVLVCPAVNMGRDHMIETLNECFEDFKLRGYNVLKAYDVEKDNYLDPRSLNPDIIFYTNPYKGLIDERYYITHYLDLPSVYINYGFSITNQPWGNGLLFHKLLWRQFCESVSIKKFIEYIQNRHSDSIVPSGYPAYDDYIGKQFNDKDWKIKDNMRKRVIWAPHHTIETVNTKEWIQFSTFFKYAHFMRKLSGDYRDKIQFVFKPHPLLKQKLYNHPDWGKEKTDEFYNFWKNGDNTNYISGEYSDLFFSSDAMLHDCGSFTIEYLYTQKPVMYLSDYNHESQINEVAKKAYKSHYIAESEKDIIEFLEKIVLKGEDTLQQKREIFFMEELLPPNGKTVAENIRDNILESIYGHL